jgi:DNA-binding NtrC family response regulator
MSVLIIDDEPSVLNALCLLLKAIGYNAQGYNDPKEALAFIESEEGASIQIVLCDLRMPEMSGFDVLKAIRVKNSELIFVLISAHANTEDVQEALSLGANGFLGKPFSPDQFHEIYNDLVPDSKVENS